MFHSWNTRQLGGSEDERLYWFGEGVTEYYASVLMLRLGIWDFAAFVREYNRFASDYFQSPARNLTADKMIVQRREDFEAERLPYRQGFLLAANWNASIQARTAGKRCFDDVMKSLVARARDSQSELTNAAIASALARAGESAAKAEIERFTVRGRTIVIDEQALGPCVTLQRRPIPVFEPGFDLDAMQSEGRARGVIPDGPAHRAGLREGQRIVGFGITHDPAVPARVVIEEADGTRKTLRFLPAVDSEKAVPQFVFLDGAASDPKCAELFMPRK